MNNLKQFKGKIDDRIFTISINQNQLQLIGEKEQINFDLSLSIRILWLFYGDKVIGFQIDDLKVEGEIEDMVKLKIFLGCQVMFGGIRKFYTFDETLYSNLNNQTKVSKLYSNRNFKVYACKSFKKQNRSMEEIFDEINLMINLQGLSFIPILYEIFESNSCIYLIMEYCYRKFDDDFTDEEFKVIIQSLFLTIKKLQELKIAHKRISRSHIMFDNDNQLKLIGFRDASLEQVSDNEYVLDIFKIGTFMYKFYQRKNFKGSEDFPKIPEQGSNLLKNILDNPSQYVKNIDKALSHSYFSSLYGEGLQQQFFEIHPKFKSNLENQVKNPNTSPNYEYFANTNVFQKDLSTELQN